MLEALLVTKATRGFLRKSRGQISVKYWTRMARIIHNNRKKSLRQVFTKRHRTTVSLTISDTGHPPSGRNYQETPFSSIQTVTFHERIPNRQSQVQLNQSFKL